MRFLIGNGETKMRRIHEMNKLEQIGARDMLRTQGWQFCSVSLDNRAGWTKGIVTIEEKDIWFEELS